MDAGLRYYVLVMAWVGPIKTALLSLNQDFYSSSGDLLF
jgi:hypothetical protein